jgi:hypothetical protein
MTSGPIVVSGFGRCGSSLVMQMLHAGGVPCLGDYPAFDGRATVQPGQAVKILDPHRSAPTPYAIPPGARVIWLDRDPSDQARSIVKFTRMLMGVNYSRDQRRALVKQLLGDRRKAMLAIGSRPLLVLSFDSLLANPNACARKLAEFVGGEFDGGEFDVDAAARQVRPRSPDCAGGMDMELALMRGGAA